jgi:hypothetical protein
MLRTAYTKLLSDGDMVQEILLFLGWVGGHILLLDLLKGLPEGLTIGRGGSCL